MQKIKSLLIECTYKKMTKLLCVGLVGMLILAGPVMAETDPYVQCGWAPNYITGLNVESNWMMPTSKQLTDYSGEYDALSSCQQYVGDKYCASRFDTASYVVVKPCAFFRTTGAANISSDLDTYWCCTNEKTWETVEGLAQSGGGDDSDEEDTLTPVVGENIVVPCVINGTVYDLVSCATAMSQTMPNVFGVNLGALYYCKDLGIGASDALYCAMSAGANKIKQTYNCPADRYAFGSGALGGKMYTVGATANTYTASGVTYAYYTVTPFTYPVCVCRDGYYGLIHTPASSSTPDCIACPCMETRNGEVCGQTTVSGGMQSTALLQAIANAGSAVPITWCKIQCDADTGCYDESGTYIQETTCAYSVS